MQQREFYQRFGLSSGFSAQQHASGRIILVAWLGLGRLVVGGDSARMAAVDFGSVGARAPDS